MKRIKPCCRRGKHIKIVDDKLRCCMYPKPEPKENHIVFDTGVVMLGGIEYCPFCGKKIEVE